MIVYLSGPITGMRDRNRRNFSKVHKKIEEILTGQKPLQIINPNKLAEIVEFQFSGKNRNLYHVIKPQWSDYMRYCIENLVRASCVYFLKGWQKSKGATLERHIAETLGIPCAETVEELLTIYRSEP
ncbi:MAG: DUF4406 domain-containing protein [Treponema sp.]|nr:DUF4406 domain-containing protein [Treponema sp.]